MSSSGARFDLVTLPKAELHLHLEGAIRVDTAADFADRYGRPMPVAGPFVNLGEFLVAYERGRDLVGSLADLHRVATEIVATARANGVVWTEVHLAPLSYAGRLGPDEGIVEAVLDGLRSASTPDSAAGLIIAVNRGLPPTAAHRCAQLALAYREAGVVGLGLAGDEGQYPAELFVDVFRRARDVGLPALPHGGEGAGADSVRACIEQLGASRVNHGVRAIEDPAVLDLLLDSDVSLDVCPTSNVALRIVAALDDHPFPRLLAAGVPMSLNTDCPLFFRTSVVAEYAAVQASFDVGDDVLADVAETSLLRSSCPADRREAALRKLALARAQIG